MSVFSFSKAERKKLKLKIGLTGPAGSGKSYTALRLARGIIGPEKKIAVINTEKNRGEIYATEFEYDILNLDPPYSPERFIQAIEAAEAAGFDMIIIDSASHEWIGAGGILDSSKKMQGNSFANWAKLTPRHDAFIEKIVSSHAHVIVCMRGKDEYVIEEDEKGKQVPRKVGLGPQQRDGFEYEFHVAFNLDMQHIAASVKDNSRLFDGTMKILTENDGIQLALWAASGNESILESVRKELISIIEKERPNFSQTQEEYLAKVIQSDSIEKMKDALSRVREFMTKHEYQKDHKQEIA